MFMKHARGMGTNVTHMEGTCVDLGLIWPRISQVIVPPIVCSSTIILRPSKSSDFIGALKIIDFIDFER